MKVDRRRMNVSTRNTQQTQKRQVTAWLRHPKVNCWNFTPSNAKRLESLVPWLDVHLVTHSDQFLQQLPETEIALVWTFEQAWFDLAPRLAMIATPAAGRDYFSVTPPPQVELRYGAFHGPIMAETVLGMILGMLRGVLASDRLMRTTAWPRATLSANMSTLRGARVTVLGFGSIGQEVGRLASLLGAQITGIRQSPAPPPPWFKRDDLQLAPEHLDAALAATDVLVTALPATAETNGLLDARRLALLPNDACLVNIGRGNVIDESLLARALQAGDLAAAALDVFEQEPLPPDSPLRRIPNLHLMPHASAVAPNYMDLFIDELAQRLLAPTGSES